MRGLEKVRVSKGEHGEIVHKYALITADEPMLS